MCLAFHSYYTVCDLEIAEINCSKDKFINEKAKLKAAKYKGFAV